MVIALCAMGACVGVGGAPTQAPELTLPATASPESSATIDWFPRTPTATFPTQPGSVPAEITQTPQARGEALFSDDFSDEALWQAQAQSTGNIKVGSGALSVALKGFMGLLVSTSQHDLPASFFLEVMVDVSLCSEGDQYGLLLWQNSVAGTYRLWMNCAGELRLDRQIYASVGVVSDWQQARKFQPGAPASNKIGLLAEAGELKVYINDTFQFSVPIRQDLEGPLGVIAQSAGNGASTILFSDLAVYQP